MLTSLLSFLSNECILYWIQVFIYLFLKTFFVRITHVLSDNTCEWLLYINTMVYPLYSKVNLPYKMFQKNKVSRLKMILPWYIEEQSHNLINMYFQNSNYVCPLWNSFYSLYMFWCADTYCWGIGSGCSGEEWILGKCTLTCGLCAFEGVTALLSHHWVNLHHVLRQGGKTLQDHSRHRPVDKQLQQRNRIQVRTQE